MNWQILPKNHEKDSTDVYYLDADIKTDASTEVYLHRKMYVADCALGGNIIRKKSRKFKTLASAKRYTEKWFVSYIKSQISELQNILNSK